MNSLLGRAIVESGIWKNMKAKNGRPEEVLVGARCPETTEAAEFLECKALKPIFPLISEPRVGRRRGAHCEGVQRSLSEGAVFQSTIANADQGVH